MRLQQICLFTSLLLGVSACAQDVASQRQATVVVFAPGSHWRGTGDQFKHLLFGKSNEVSFGEFFDNQTRVAYLTHSRYLIISLPAGVHTFSASMSKKHPDQKQTLRVDLKPGSVSYFALTATMTNWGAGVFSTETSHIEEASCKEFDGDTEANKSEPVTEKRITEAFRSQVKPLSVLPTCTP